jgi:protein gp37
MMGKDTAIEWATHTWNPWLGCHKVSAGCANCYAERLANQFGWKFTEIHRTKDAAFYLPRRLKDGLVFTCSLSDFFLPEADEWRPRVWEIIASTPRLTYLILTKRPELIRDRLPSDWGEGYENVWLGTSVENQKLADKRIPILIDVPAVLRFLSCEPLLGEINLVTPGYILSAGSFLYGDRPPIGWVIAGGESDPVSPRPTELDWLRSLRDQCNQTGVPFFMKQLGGRSKVNGSWGGRVLDGAIHSETPPVRVAGTLGL